MLLADAMMHRRWIKFHKHSVHDNTNSINCLYKWNIYTNPAAIAYCFRCKWANIIVKLNQWQPILCHSIILLHKKFLTWKNIDKGTRRIQLHKFIWDCNLWRNILHSPNRNNDFNDIIMDLSFHFTFNDIQCGAIKNLTHFVRSVNESLQTYMKCYRFAAVNIFATCIFWILYLSFLNPVI